MTTFEEKVRKQLESGMWRTAPEIARVLIKEDPRAKYYTTRCSVCRTLSILEKYHIVERKRVQNTVFWRLSQ